MKIATCHAAARFARAVIVALSVHHATGAETIRALSWNMASGAELPVSASNSIYQAAMAFKVVEPEVILLQHVKDWQTCEKLVQALKPADYRVVICSSFRERESGRLIKDQVGILARVPAYFSWYESWVPVAEAQVAGGFAFMAVQVGKQRFGFYAMQFGAARAGLLEECARQVLKHVHSVHNWANNRIQGSLLAATFESPGADFFNRPVVKLLSDAGYQDVLAEMSETQRNTFRPGLAAGASVSDFLFAQPAGCSGNPRLLAASDFSKYPLLCDLDLDPAVLASQVRRKRRVTTPPVATASAPQPPASKQEPIGSAIDTPNAALPPANPAPDPDRLVIKAEQAPVKGLPAGAKPVSYAWISGTIACLLAAVILGAVLARRVVVIKRFSGRKTPMNAGVSPYVVVMPRSVSGAADQPLPDLVEPHVQVEFPGAHQTRSHAQREYSLSQTDAAADLLRAGLLGQFSQWLKDRFVRKLLSDRADLMQAQEAAALKALAVHERLSRVEDQIQQQNDSYQRRIAELSAELLTAREENRALISDRIRQIKAEMEAARAKALANARNAEEVG